MSTPCAAGRTGTLKFWNLLLDDYRLHISTKNDLVRLALLARTPGAVTRPLGHELMIKREKHELWAFLKRAPEDWTFTALHRASIAARTRGYLEQHLGEPVTIRDLAQALHVSVRTLNRRFAEEGTHFQAVKDGLRRDIAVHRLANSNTAVAALAFDLGFADATGFCRAFRHWTGSSPSDYRKGTRQDE